MSQGRKIRCYDYVNHPYAPVREALTRDPLRVFQSATKAAAYRAQSIAAELHVDIGGVGVTSEIDIVVKAVEERERATGSNPATTLKLEWKAKTMPQWFPVMQAELSIYPLTATETQLDFSGLYVPPFGLVGEAVNALAGHRIAEASVHGFVTDLAVHLRKVLA